MQQPEALSVRFSIVLPARNEEERIGETLALYYDFFAKHCEAAFEFLIVANACTDRTLSLIHISEPTRPY